MAPPAIRTKKAAHLDHVHDPRFRRKVRFLFCSPSKDNACYVRGAGCIQGNPHSVVRASHHSPLWAKSNNQASTWAGACASTRNKTNKSFPSGLLKSRSVARLWVVTGTITRSFGPWLGASAATWTLREFRSGASGATNGVKGTWPGAPPPGGGEGAPALMVAVAVARMKLPPSSVKVTRTAYL